MTEQQREAILKLIDEAERTLLALQDGPLSQGDLPGLRRAIGRMKKRILLNVSSTNPLTCVTCGKPMMRIGEYWIHQAFAVTPPPKRKE